MPNPTLTFTPLDSSSSDSKKNKNLTFTPLNENNRNLTFTPLSDYAVDNKGGLTFTPLEELPQAPETYSFGEAFWGSLAEELTLGAFYDDPGLDSDKLTMNAKIGKTIGTGLGFFAWVGVATISTGGLGGIAMLASTGSRLQKGAKLYNAAKKGMDISGKVVYTTKSAKKVAMADAVAEAGIGVKSSGLIGKLGINGPGKSHIDKFMRLAEKDVGAARRYALGREMTRESLIWGSTGQLIVEDDATLKERALAFGQDAAAGAIFAYAPSRRYMKNPHWKKGGQLVDEIGTGVTFTKLAQRDKRAWSEAGLYMASGMMMYMPGQDEMNASEQLTSRLLMGGVTTVMGRLFGGATLNVAKQDTIRAFERLGITDERQLGELSSISMALGGKQGLEVMNDMYKGLEFWSKPTGKRGQTSNRAIVKKVFIEKDSGKLKVQYDTYQGQSTKIKNKDVQENFDIFTLGRKNKKGERVGPQYKRLDDNKVQEIIHNIKKDADGKNLRHVISGARGEIKNQKDLLKFLNEEKYAIISADSPVYNTKSRRILPGETQAEALVRELIDRGVSRENVMSTKGLMIDGTHGTSFIVKMKGLKGADAEALGKINEKDVIELAKLFGQETVFTNKGLMNIIRPAKNQYSIKEVTYQKVDWITGASKQRGWTRAGSITSKNNKEVVWSYKFKEGSKKQSIQDPSLSKKFKFQRADEILGSIKVPRPKVPFTIQTPEHIQLVRQTETLERAMGLKSPVATKAGVKHHTALKQALFGKDSMKKMNNDELAKYYSLLKSDKTYAVRLNETTMSTLFGQEKSILGGIKKWVNSILPINTKFMNLGRDLGSDELVVLGKDLGDMVLLREKLKGGYQAIRNSMKDIASNLSKESKKKLDESLMYFIEGKTKTERGRGLKQLQPSLTAEEHDVMLRMVAMHKQYTDDMLKHMKNAGVKEKYWDVKSKSYKYRDIKKTPNFVSLTTTDEAAEFFMKDKDAHRDMINQILEYDKRFIGIGPYARLDTRRKEKLAEEIFETIIAGSQKHGMFGAQYSRISDAIKPKLFIGSNGRIIQGVDDMTLKAGDSVKGIKISRVIDFYEPNYSTSMDRYASRAANITATTKYFGHEGVYRAGMSSGNFSSNFSKRFRRIQRQVGTRGAQDYIKKLMQEDLELVLHGPGYNELTGPLSRNLVSWTASLGLSSPRSALKNLLLGNVQLVATHGLSPVLDTWFSIATSGSFRKKAWDKARASGAIGASDTILETALVPKQGVRKWLTHFMKKAEEVNRVVSTVSGDILADNALKVLRNQPISMFRGMDKSTARRVLGEALDLSDKQIADAVETGVFSQRAIDKIYFTAHSSTQGLPDPVFMPHFMSTQFMKPFTLFYRIAYRVTENVYKNAYRPLIDNGEIAPMARYIAASMGAGYALQNTYYQLFNSHPKAFKPEQRLKDLKKSTIDVARGDIDWDTYRNQIVVPIERLNDYAIKGEMFGIGSGLMEQDMKQGGFMARYTPAIIQMPFRMAGAVSQIFRGGTKLLDKDANGQDAALLKQGFRAIGEAIPISNDIMKTIESNWARENLRHFKNMRITQAEYKKDVRNIESVGTFNDDVTKSLMYKQLQGNLYSNNSIEDKVSSFWTTVYFLAHQHEMSNTGRVSQRASMIYGYKQALEYLKDQKPIQLSKKRTQNRTKSDYEDFVQRLNPERQQELKDIELVYRAKYQELIPYIVSSRNEHFKRLKN